MKKIILMFLTIMILLPGDKNILAQEEIKNKKILVSTYSLWLIAKNIVAESEVCQLELLIPAKTLNIPKYKLTKEDKEKLAEADLVILLGNGLEKKAEKDISKTSSNGKVFSIYENAIEMLEEYKVYRKVVRVVDEKHKVKRIYESPIRMKINNPYWVVDPNLNEKIAEVITKEIIEIAPEDRELYQKNYQEYKNKMQKLIKEIREKVGYFKSNKMFTQHETFEFFALSFDLDIVDFIEPLENKNKNLETKYLKDVAISEGVKVIFTDKGFNDRLCKKVAYENHLKIATLDPVLSGNKNVENDHYFKVMKKNIKVMEKYLGIKGKY